ncbi:extracellular solute-binding protein [Alkaliphilus pronyensis]|uniref:Extracellular solute-binding protein n=1 Tax=Alkaliphilus pronyensis TaxID=1482732 RepID=A0A6I0FF50_9FIRM|nr:extracellular solute-binding protein [Alkaliphilus pronyensis]KAB3537866.1 extracellular solute-binding protein [Alkaliphilus pronyensis]
MVKRNKIHFFLFILLALFICIGPYYFANYKPTEITLEENTDSLKWKGVISFWDYPRLDKKTGGQYNWIREKIKSFEKKHPGVYIDFHPIDWEKGSIKLENALKLGSPPDIIPVGSDYSIIASGILEPLNIHLSTEEIKDFDEVAIKTVTFNGEILAVPWMMTTYTLILNLDMFKERGVEPPVDGIWTYEEFIEKLQRLTFDSKGRGKIDHYGFNSFIKEGYYNTWGIILSDGGRIIDNQLNYVFNDKAAYSGVGKLLDMKHKYAVVHPAFGENTSNQAWTSFYRDQNVAVIPTGTWAFNVLDRLKQEGKGFEYDVALFPIGELGKPVTMSNSIGSYGIAKQEDKEKLQMCVELLKYIVTEENQSQLDRLGVFPVKKSVGNIYANNSKMSTIYESLKNTVIIPPHPYWNEIDEAIQKQLQQGLLGKKDLNQILQDAEDNVTSLIQLKSRH